MSVERVVYGSLVVIVIKAGLMVGTNSMGEFYKKIKYAGNGL